MDMNFAIGLSQGIAWPWPIAVYLFLAGISGGAVAAAVILNLYRKQAHENTPVLKAASVIGAATILLGMVCLVLDLTNPFNFWRILIYYNPTSVMSLGVMALLVYIPTVCILTLVALRGLLPKVGLGFLDGIVGFFDGWRVVLQWIALVFALTICAYTGFLISALIRFPLINQAVLPALFVASGLSAGMAATKAFACLAFGDRHESCDQHLLHAAEWPVMAAEALCIFMIAVALVNGNAAAQAAFAAFTTGAWAIEFWVGLGFLDGIVGFFDGWRVVLQWIALVFALTICAYTGFLISALIRFPLINQAVLPALFVASGLSAGMAATKAFACLAFGDRHESCDQHLLHAAEWPVMAAEALCIFMIAVALVNGNAAAQAAFAAFTTGAWAIEFWVGVVCVGFCGPLVLGLIGGGLMSFYLSALCSVAGMMCLRLFILYAGQLHGL